MEILPKKIIIMIHDFSLVMDKHGEALIIAREEEVIRHGNVLFGLVKPRREGKELLLESSAAMVNVLPRKRFVYSPGLFLKGDFHDSSHTLCKIRLYMYTFYLAALVIRHLAEINFPAS